MIKDIKADCDGFLWRGIATLTALLHQRHVDVNALLGRVTFQRNLAPPRFYHPTSLVCGT